MLVVYIVIALVLVGAALRLFGKPPEDPPEDADDEDIRRLVREGRRIDAIRWHRLLHGTDVREARAAIDAMSREEG